MFGFLFYFYFGYFFSISMAILCYTDLDNFEIISNFVQTKLPKNYQCLWSGDEIKNEICLEYELYFVFITINNIDQYNQDCKHLDNIFTFLIYDPELIDEKDLNHYNLTYNVLIDKNDLSNILLSSLGVLSSLTPTKKQLSQLLSCRNTILVAEDEDISYRFLEILLSRICENLKIIRAHNGKEAVEIFTEKPDIPLIFMDIKMPIMNGFEAIQIIKSIRPDVPIVAQTAFTQPEDKAKARSVGVNDFISKPVTKDVLFKVVSRYFSLDSK